MKASAQEIQRQSFVSDANCMQSLGSLFRVTVSAHAGGKTHDAVARRVIIQTVTTSCGYSVDPGQLQYTRTRVACPPVTRRFEVQICIERAALCNGGHPRFRDVAVCE